MKNKPEHRAIAHLKNYSKNYPNAWPIANSFILEPPMYWPKYVLLPVSGWYTIIANGHGVETLDMQQAQQVPLLSAIGTWRYSKAVYSFDVNLHSSLLKSAITGNIPSEVFYKLPNFCLYIEADSFLDRWAESPLYGFFVHLEYDVTTKISELRFIFDTDHGLVPVMLHLGNWSIRESIAKMFDVVNQNLPLEAEKFNPDHYEALAADISPYLSLVIYLCSDEPDVNNHTKNAGRPSYKYVKGAAKVFAPKDIGFFTVGESVGKKLSSIYNYNVKADGTSKKPHIRRGHWHGYYKGNANNKTFFYKWIPPLFVGGGSSKGTDQ